MVLPTGITQISNLDFETLLEFGSFIHDEFRIECWEELFGCFWILLFLGLAHLLFQFLNLLIAFFLVLF